MLPTTVLLVAPLNRAVLTLIRPFVAVAAPLNILCRLARVVRADGFLTGFGLAAPLNI